MTQIKSVEDALRLQMYFKETVRLRLILIKAGFILCGFSVAHCKMIPWLGREIVSLRMYNMACTLDTVTKYSQHQSSDRVGNCY